MKAPPVVRLKRLTSQNGLHKRSPTQPRSLLTRVTQREEMRRNKNTTCSLARRLLSFSGSTLPPGQQAASNCAAFPVVPRQTRSKKKKQKNKKLQRKKSHPNRLRQNASSCPVTWLPTTPPAQQEEHVPKGSQKHARVGRANLSTAYSR